jgi:alanine racemase
MDANDTQESPRLLISPAALLANVRLLRSRLRPGTKICAVVKADAYGLGAAIVVDALCNFGNAPGNPGDAFDASTHAPADAPPIVDQFAVATIDEAAQLPPVALPVLILRPVENVYLGRSRSALELAVRQGWVLTLASPAAADDLARVAVACGRRCAVHVAVDSGLSRCGVALEDLDALLARIEQLDSLRLVSLSTHFSNSDQPRDAYTDWQLNRFLNVTDAYVVRNPNVIRHAANTGGIFHTPAAHLDCVRPGIGLYGIDPSLAPNMDRPLRPAMRWTAPLIAVRVIPEGATVGYGQTYVAPCPTRIGLVPVGYADGYRRDFSNRAAMLVDNQLAPVIGRVSMDLTVINLTSIPHARVGDQATILDDDPLSPVSIYALSRWAQTIPYELLCGIGPRVRRVTWEPASSEHEAIAYTPALPWDDAPS